MSTNFLKPGSNVLVRQKDGLALIGTIVSFDPNNPKIFELKNSCFVEYDKLISAIDGNLKGYSVVGAFAMDWSAIQAVLPWPHHLPSTNLKSLKKVSKKS